MSVRKESMEYRFEGQDRVSGMLRKLTGKSGFQGLAIAAAGVGVAFLAVRGASRLLGGAMNTLSDLSRRAISEAQQQEQANIKLKAAMVSTGQYTEMNYQRLLDYGSQLEQVTNYTDDQIISAEAMLQTFKLAPDVIEKATLATLNLASATGQDLQAAAILMGKAAVGVTDTLTRYGIIIDKDAYAARGFEVVLEEINTEFGGQAVAQALSYVGALGLVKKGYSEILEAAGTFITESKGIRALYRAIAEQLFETADAVGELRKENAQFVADLISKSLVSLLDLVSTLEEVEWNWRLMRMSAKHTGEDIKSAVSPIRDALEDIGEATYKGLSTLKEWGEKFDEGFYQLTGYRGGAEKATDAQTRLARSTLESARAQEFWNAVQKPLITGKIHSRLEELIADYEKYLAIEPEKAPLPPGAAAPGAAPGEAPLPAWMPDPEVANKMLLDQVAEQIKISEDAKKRFLEVHSDFSAAYAEITLGRFGQEWELMEQDYELYDQYLNDKSRLDEWYAETKMQFIMDVAQYSAGMLSENLAAMAQSGMISGQVAKRAAQIKAMVDAYVAANAAMSAMSAIPVVGPALGAIAYATTLARGLASVRMIEKQKFARGGIQLRGPARDDILYRGEFGEYVVPPGPAARNREYLDMISREGAIPGGAPERMSAGGGGNTIIIERLETMDPASFQDWIRFGPGNEEFVEASRMGYLTPEDYE